MGYRNIGTISRTHGTAGAMILTQCPDTSINIKPGTQVLVGFSASFSKPFTLTSCETYKQSLIITLNNVTMNDIAELKDNGVFIDESALLRGDDNYFISDLIGCAGIDEDGKLLGTITDVWIMPANDVWVLSMPEGDIPLPVIDEVILSVDIQKKQIVIRLIDGLLDLLPRKSDDSHLD